MNNHYVTFILRLQLNDGGSSEMSYRRISGSMQQVGYQEIHYFDTPEKFHKTLQCLLPLANISSGTTNQPSAEERRS